MGSLSGVLPILPTIFTPKGGVDEAGTRRVVEYIIAAGARGIVFPGLASEYETLSRDERLHMTRVIGEWVGKRVPFVVGASAVATNDAVEFAAAGAAAGAVAAMVLTPKVFADDPVGMRDFYREVHRGSGIDIMLQNAPAPMGIGLSLEKVADLARAVDGIRYVKEEAPPSGQRITKLTELAGDSLAAVFGGAGARDLFERTLPLLNMQAVFRWRLTKAVLERRGVIDSTFVRAAGPELDRYDRLELDALLARLAD